MIAYPLAEILSVDVPEPGAAMGLGLKLTPTPKGTPDTDRLMDDLKLPSAAVVIVELAELPLCTVSAVGDALIEKSGFARATVRVTMVVCVMPPPLPVTVIV